MHAVLAQRSRAAIDRHRRRLDLRSRATWSSRCTSRAWATTPAAREVRRRAAISSPRPSSAALRPHARAAAARARLCRSSSSAPAAVRSRRRSCSPARLRVPDRRNQPAAAARQQARLGARARWLERLPERFRGVVIANEVVDAMPVHAVAWRQHGILERGVALSSDQLIWEERPATGELLEEARKIRCRASLRERDRPRRASLDARNRRAAGRRRDLHHRLRLSAPRVLPPAARDAAR